MELNLIYTRTTWNDAVGSINSNYAKIADAIAQLKANGGGGGSGADIDLTAYATKVWVEAKGYITASTLTPYALKTDIPSLVGYATEDFVNNQLGDYATKDYVTTKLVNYAPLTSVQGFENRIAGLEGAVPQLNERVSTVEGKVSSLNETVSTGKNNLLERVNVIEEEYATKTYVDNAIVGIDLSPYLKTEDAEDTYATKDYVNNKLTNYATTDSVTAMQNTLTGQIGAVDARVDSNDEQIAILNETTSGHTTSIGTLTQRVDSVEHLASTKLDSSYFTLTNIKSTLGISDWALAATKPSYTASEVDATPSLGDVGANSVKGNGLGYTYATSAHGGQTAGGFISFGKTSYGCQLNGSIYGGELAFRGLNNGTFTSWKILAFTDSNVASATKLQTPRTLWGQSFDGTSDVNGNINVTSITINGVTITASNGSITVNGNVLATGAITAKKVG